jgi:hypothetical protein
MTDCVSPKCRGFSGVVSLALLNWLLCSIRMSYGGIGMKEDKEPDHEVEWGVRSPWSAKL